MEFIKQLRNDTFDALDVTGYSPDLQGWMAPQFFTVFNSFLNTYKTDKPLTVVEVGSWKGLSAYTMCNILKANKHTDANVICIDTWLGAPEFWTWGNNDKDRGVSLNKISGYPSVFYTFTKNMKASGHSDMIAPLPLPSTEAIHVLKHYNIQPDIIYIDASHEYESVKKDMELYWDTLKPGGMMFGDDFMKGTWDGVVQAVTEFHRPPTVNGVVWSVRK